MKKKSHLLEREITLAEMLRDASYATACIGKWHQGWIPEFLPLAQGFDTYFGDDVSSSIKRIKERERIYRKLEKINCGLCGSPTCHAFAEDVVVGVAKLGDCPFLAGKLERRTT